MMGDKKQQVGSIKNALEEYVKLGQFEYAFIADDSGLPLVCAGPSMATLENQAAVLTRIKNTISMVGEQKGLGTIEETVFNVAGKKKLVCRNFVITGKSLILAVTMDSHQSYRRLTGTFIHHLQLLWQL